ITPMSPDQQPGNDQNMGQFSVKTSAPRGSDLGDIQQSRGSKLDADYPHNGVNFARRNTADNQAADSCYSVALMSWDDRFGLRNEALARQYADLSCQIRSTNNEACQMQRHFQIEDSWKDFSQQDALSKPAEP